MTARRRCEACGAPLYAPEYAARLDDRDGVTVWCMACWDDPSEKAVNQYRCYSVMAQQDEDRRSANLA